MLSEQIRNAYLDFFKEKGHLVQPSYPLVPKDDPTLLFNSAGMVPFKDYFAGVRTPPSKRISTCQKCLRETDLENVGYTLRHHTFFEMLGNFSFGDYFKEEAIKWAWELVTEVFNLEKDRLYITIYKDDDEAFDIWKKIGIPESRIIRLGEDTNFWGPAGEVGPCGPCSEILYDQGEAFSCGKPDCAPGCDCDRYLEIWNLVFTQFYKTKDGKFEELKQKNIDTGMGLERIASVLQKVAGNFETDLFMPIISKIAEISNKEYGIYKDIDVAFRVIADHIRALVFTISEGLTPSNESRGYVLRRLLRRAARYGRKLNLTEPFLYKVVPAVVDKMGPVYPELYSTADMVTSVVRTEEEKFQSVIERGLYYLEKELEKIPQGSYISGEVVFKLFDTYGFPVDIVIDIAKERGFKVDLEGFEEKMEEQRQRARQAWQGAKLQAKVSVLEEFSETIFTGYEKLEETAKVLAILKEENEELKKIDLIQEEGEYYLVFDKTCFYAESGGQLADSGLVKNEKFSAEVLDVQKPIGGVFLHKVKAKGNLKVNDEVILKVDIDRRRGLQRAHTATHLMHKALREILGEHVKQAGSLVDDDYLRFDFSHHLALTDLEIKKVQNIVFEKILDNLKVNIEETTLEEARKKGAMALFDYKYGKTVRLVNIGDYSLELCGGTHCKHTGEIGVFIIVSESSISSGSRRIEALVGKKAYKFLMDNLYTVKQVQGILKQKDIVEAVANLLKENKEKNKKIEQLKQKLLTGSVGNDVKIEDLNEEIAFVISKVEAENPNELRMMADKYLEQIEGKNKKKGIVLLVSEGKKKANLVAKASKNLVDKLSMSDFIKEVAKILGGSGGGKPHLAQGGAKSLEKLKEAFDKARQLLKKVFIG